VVRSILIRRRTALIAGGNACPTTSLSRPCWWACEASWRFAKPSIFATAAGGLFFPLAARLGMPPRSNVTTKVLQKVIWAGANNGSYALAAEALAELSEVSLSPKQIRRLVVQIGAARLAERDDAVEQLQAMSFAKRREGSGAVAPPELAVISMDGGRYQRRDHFRGQAEREAAGAHWRETKVGCLLSMQSELHTHDPTPCFPAWLATSTAIAELAKSTEKTLLSAIPPCREEQATPREEDLGYEPPRLLAREVMATSHDAERFGWELEARAWQLGFPSASRQAFVADGLAVNWTIARRHFPHAVPILDLMHALSYAWSAAHAVDDGTCYRTWAQWIWQGQVTRVIAALTNHQARLGTPPPEAEANDPRSRVARALTYYTNNQTRMNYPRYRQQGLPLTSSHIESTIKQINARIKGTEKFWEQTAGDAVLQLRADTLSDSKPLNAFWTRWLAQQTGANCYRTAA